MSDYVLDASALLALLNGEEGAESVRRFLPDAVISAVNLAEVVTRLTAVGMPERDVREVLSILAMETVPFDEEQAYHAGLLYLQTRAFGLSLGDRACLALARTMNVPAITADQMDHAYTGPRFTNGRVAGTLDRHGLDYAELDDNAMCRTAAGLLSAGNVVGWFQGAMEWGPRALGNRSILADPRRDDMR